MSEIITTYEPDNSLKKGYLSIFSEIYNEFMKNRWLTYQLFKREFFTLYKQSFIGVLWAFIIPLVSVGKFIILNRSGVFFILVIVLFIYYKYYKITPSTAILLVPLFMIPIMLLTLGLGFILSLLNGIMRDIGNMFSILITFFIFLTPVLYASHQPACLHKLFIIIHYTIWFLLQESSY